LPQSSHKTMKKNNMIKLTKKKELMTKTKQFNLYTFNVGKFCYTETETLNQAISNFNQRVNLDPNGLDHPNMNYSFAPIRIITAQNITDEMELDRSNSETILKFKMNELNNLILA
jgi:hypothetical protein